MTLITFEVQSIYTTENVAGKTLMHHSCTCIVLRACALCLSTPPPSLHPFLNGADWALTRGFSPAVLLMPLSFACIFGGLVTIIGTSTNLVVQGLVLDEAKNDPTIEGIGFLEPGYIGLPLGMVGMLYLVVAAPRVLAGAGGGGGGGGGGGDGVDRGGAEHLLTEVACVCASFCVWLRAVVSAGRQSSAGATLQSAATGCAVVAG